MLDIHVQSRPRCCIRSRVHSVGGLHIFDHASRPAVDAVAGCSSQRNGSQPRYNQIRIVLKRVIASFQCIIIFICSKHNINEAQQQENDKTWTGQ